jgi:hypothetical protein
MVDTEVVNQFNHGNEEISEVGNTIEKHNGKTKMLICNIKPLWNTKGYMMEEK